VVGEKGAGVGTLVEPSDVVGTSDGDGDGIGLSVG
jgi:hypothetical protein